MPATTWSSCRRPCSVVVMGCRPAGLPESRETDISPHWVSSRVRGIGVAVITSMSAASPFCQHQPLRHAEAVLLIHHGKAEVAERHALLEQRMGADDDVD